MSAFSLALRTLLLSWLLWSVIPAAAQLPRDGAFTLAPSPIYERAFNRADVATGPDGRLHAVFMTVAEDDTKPVYYGTCAASADCSVESSWAYVVIGSDLPFLQIRLTADGAPRVFMYNDFLVANSTFTTLYAYAECDADCTSGAAWRSTNLWLSDDSGGLRSSQFVSRRFTLDANGHPHFVYQKGLEAVGEFQTERTNYLASCREAPCDSPDRWQRVRLPLYYFSDDLERSSLAATSDGRLLLTTLFWDDVSQYRVGYLECTGGCDSTDDWSVPVLLWPIGDGSLDGSWATAVSESGGVRLVIEAEDSPMTYAWCDAACTDAGNWLGYPVQFGADPELRPALALDAGGRPHVAFQSGSDLGYAYCKEACETDAPVWMSGLVETASQLDAFLPTPVPAECRAGTWIGGYRPALVLSGGHPRLAYDAEYLLQCYNDPQNPNPGNTTVRTAWWASRVVYFDSDDSTIPVELAFFDAQLDGRTVVLVWQTASETNNAGFEVERAEDAESFAPIGFVAGAGTTASVQSYRFQDARDTPGGRELRYRLRQVDLDGTATYSAEVAVQVPLRFHFAGAAPNPFSATTDLRFELDDPSPVRLTVYDVVGRRVAVLVDTQMPAGDHRVRFDAQTLASGLYFARLDAGPLSRTQKLVVVK